MKGGSSRDKELFNEETEMALLSGPRAQQKILVLLRVVEVNARVHGGTIHTSLQFVLFCLGGMCC